MNQPPQSPNPSLAVLARQGKELRANLRKPLSIESKRIALERKIILDFPHFKGFLTEYSSNISMTGMFVRSETPEPAGTVVAFEFRLADGLNLIRGQAEVIWRRLKDDGPSRPAGMGLRFVRLDKESRRLIRWAVEKHLREGGATFELDGDQIAEDSANETPEQPLDGMRSVDMMDLVHPGAEDAETRARLHPYAGAAVARSSLGTWRRVVYPATVLLLIAGLAVLFTWLRGGSSETGSVETARAEGTASDEVVEAGTASAPESPTAPEAELAEAPEPDAEAAVLDRLEAWALAWSEQRVDDYLAFYSPHFEPPRGGSREEWSTLRRTRIERPQHIEVRISEIETAFPNEKRSTVTFLQEYASERYRDTTRKVLEMALEEGQWMFLTERSTS